MVTKLSKRNIKKYYKQKYKKFKTKLTNRLLAFKSYFVYFGEKVVH